MVAGNFNVAFPEPFTETAAPVLVASESAIEIFLAVPQLAVVIFAEPLNDVPLIVLAVASVVAVAELPVQDAELPVTLIPHDPEAPPPVLVGA